MNISPFENEFNEYFKKIDTPVKKFIIEKHIMSKNKVYLKFFQIFLLPYGVYAFNSFSCKSKRGFTPFINCQENNIFGLKAGITDLSTKPLSLNESEAEIARFLIKQFKSISVKKLKNWSKDQF